MYKNRAYIIRTKTNLHAGSADSGFGIIDKEVQRDSISNLPVINGSSLKGAVRDHFREMLASTNDLPMGDERVKPFTFRVIFGDEEDEKKLDEEDNKSYDKLPKQGLVKFIDARLLFLPLRSNKRPYYHVTSLSTLKEAQAQLHEMGIDLSFGLENLPKNKSVVIDNAPAQVEDVVCEAFDTDVSTLKSLFGIEHLAVFGDEDFNEVLEGLPVIARNSLKNGKSENLWYEEVVPRESVFITVWSYYDNFDTSRVNSKGKTDKDRFENAFTLFESKILKDHIQIGANASIGYGICTFSKLGGAQ